MNNVVHYPFNNVVQHLWSNNCCSALLNEDRTRIDRTRLFAIVIIVAQPCRHVVTVLMVKQGCNDVIVLAERTTLLTTLFMGGAQHCSGLFTTSNMLCVYMRLLCVYARVDGASFQEGNLHFSRRARAFSQPVRRRFSLNQGSRLRWCPDGLGNSEQLNSRSLARERRVILPCTCLLHTTITEVYNNPEFQCFCLTYFHNWIFKHSWKFRHCNRRQCIYRACSFR